MDARFGSSILIPRKLADDAERYTGKDARQMVVDELRTKRINGSGLPDTIKDADGGDFYVVMTDTQPGQTATRVREMGAIGDAFARIANNVDDSKGANPEGEPPGTDQKTLVGQFRELARQVDASVQGIILGDRVV